MSYHADVNLSFEEYDLLWTLLGRNYTAQAEALAVEREDEPKRSARFQSMMKSRDLQAKLERAFQH